MAQDLVSGLMAVAVVDLLEAVDVHEQRGNRDILASRPSQELLGAVEHQDSVRKVRQRIVQGEVLQLAGPLSDETPCPLARARQHAMEQEHEDRDEQTETQGDEAPQVGGGEGICRSCHLQDPAFSELATGGVAR